MHFTLAISTYQSARGSELRSQPMRQFEFSKFELLRIALRTFLGLNIKHHLSY